MMNDNRKPNRLINSKSPYLLQHAYNPVEWYEWEPEAFERAKRENKPIFLSIGYSTCHWCHVMERESFEDEEVANLLNKNFVSIKVDREERPDIDSLYMRVCQMMTGQGGWPLTVFLTPDKKPFYAGTYFPKHSKYGRPGMLDLLPQIANAYKSNPQRIDKITSQLTEALQERPEAQTSKGIQETHLHEAYNGLLRQFDAIYGGFGQPPKFPLPHQHLFLMRYYYWTGNKQALQMVTKTLDAMLDGGIYDQLGSGFARYSVDGKWLVPHFEKMLYDQALMLFALTEAYQITKNERYKQVIKEVVSFIQREMTDSQGAFYSAIDADSEGEEGTYYIWSKQEVIDLLGPKEGEVFCDVFNMTEQGNFEGKNILNLIRTSLEKLASNHNISIDQVEKIIQHGKKTLFERRQQRVYPHVDDKVLTSWNGLMIAALAKAGAALKEATFLQMANRALQFIEQHLWTESGLKARYRDGEVKYQAYLDDYAFLLWAYVELFQAEGQSTYLHQAIKLYREMMNRFWDPNGGFYFTDENGEQLLVREKQWYDGAIPSGNGIASYQLWRLYKLTNDEQMFTTVKQLLQAAANEVTHYPSGYLCTVQTAMALSHGGEEVVVSGKDERKDEELFQWLRTSFLPFTVFQKQEDVSKQWTVQICQQFVCQQPVHTVEEVKKYFIKNEKND
jgi:uncharacterized protein